MIELIKWKIMYALWFFFDYRKEATEWFGNVMTYTSALIVALWPDITKAFDWGSIELQWWCFLFYFIGSFTWAVAGWYMKNSRLIWLNVFFVFLNSYAMYIRL